MTDKQPDGAAVTQRQREEAKQTREREAEWDKHPFPKSRDRERDANERAYWRAVAEIPNPGPVEPLTELQAFHAEQTDPPPGPYPDPPLGPYPDPVIKERPAEEVIYGRTGEVVREREGRQGKEPRDVQEGGREYDEPNFDGYDEDIRDRETSREARPEKRGHAGRSEADRPADRSGQR